MSCLDSTLEILRQLSPGEVIEMCNLEDSAEDVTDALEDYIAENLDKIRENLIISGLLEEDEDGE